MINKIQNHDCHFSFTGFDLDFCGNNDPRDIDRRFRIHFKQLGNNSRDRIFMFDRTNVSIMNKEFRREIENVLRSLTSTTMILIVDEIYDFQLMSDVSVFKIDHQFYKIGFVLETYSVLCFSIGGNEFISINKINLN